IIADVETYSQLARCPGHSRFDRGRSLLMTASGSGRQALVVSGGGASAAYGVGVMKALLDGESSATGYAPLDPEIYTGTSGGAGNVAIMVSQPDIPTTAAVRHLEQIWVDHISENPLRCGNGVFRIRGNPFQYATPQCIAANPVRPFMDLAGDAAFF